MPSVAPMPAMAEIQHNTQTKIGPQAPQNIPAPQPAEAQVQEQPKTDPDPRLTEYQRREKILLRRQRELAHQQKLNEEKYAKWEQAEKAQTPLDKLKAIGLSYDDLTNQVLNYENLTPEQKLEMRMQSQVDQKLQALQQQQLEESRKQQQVQYDQAKRQISADIKHTLDNSQNFPLVKSLGAFDTVTERIEDHFHRTGELIPIERALHLEEQDLKAYLGSVMKDTQIRSYLFGEEEPKAQATSQIESQKPRVVELPNQQTVKTLTHKQTTTSPSKPLTSAQKRQRAMNIFNGLPPETGIY